MLPVARRSPDPIAEPAHNAAGPSRASASQLAFEPQARPELEATVARLDIDFARHVRPTAAMLWSRINKGRILDIARTVFGVAWASARSKYKKPALAEAMEAAFAAGDWPVGIGAGAHAAALAWMPPGFAAFDTGGVDEDADGVVQATQAVSGDASAGPAGGGEAVPDETGETPAAGRARMSRWRHLCWRIRRASYSLPNPDPATVLQSVTP
ncbi:MAG: hypothetical protein OYH76_11435 [Defluviicoccus sp.]|nr:hypothetical protein [Defluviicoccus sp.]